MTKNKDYFTVFSTDSTISIENIAYSNYSNNYGRDIDGQTTVRPTNDRESREFWHPDESYPDSHRSMMIECDDAYKTVGIVRNVIDLMSDFLTQNIGVRHPNPSQERFYQNWFARVDGSQVSETIARNLFKSGTCIISSDDFRVTKRSKKDIRQSRASLETTRQPNNVVPGKYKFYNPALIDVVGGNISGLSGKPPIYGMRIPQSVLNIILAPSTKQERDFVSSLPKTVVDAVRENPVNPIIPMEKLQVLHYKKDDWQSWATPMLSGILYNIKMLKKLQLADMSALDSSMDIVRLWRIGNLEHKIMPNEGAFSELRKSLEVPNHGVRDIVWSPVIECDIKQIDVSKILGPEKYESTLNAIYIGLGIPPSLAGNASSGSGTTNNLISLKTLIKRLEYGRQILRQFWTAELEKVRKGLGWTTPAEIYFDNTNLGDEEAEKKLWIDLADRDIVSHEAVQERFGAIPVIEKNRLNKERRDRDAERTVPKSGPFHDGQIKQKVLKNLIETDRVDPKELNIDVELKQPENQNIQTPSSDPEPQNTPGRGRPAGSVDTEPRKRRAFKPQTRAVWFGVAVEKTQEVVQRAILEATGKDNLRKLSKSEQADMELLRTATVFNLEPLSDLTEQSIILAAQKPLPTHLLSLSKQEIRRTEQELGRELNSRERLEVEKQVWINYE